MAKLDGKKTGLVLGCFFALIHLVWTIFVAITPSGVQKFMDWMLGLHRISVPVTIMPFHLMSAILLVVMTFVFGYIFGYVFATLWNHFVKK